MKILKLLLALTAIIFIYSCVDDNDDLIEESSLETEERQVTLGDWEARPCANITIFVEPDCHNNWVDGVADAIQEYNNVPDISIEIQQVEVNEPPADIVINCVDFGGGFANLFGLAEFPLNDGEIGDDIFLNTDFDENCTDPCLYASVLMHEIGHNLGILHNESSLGVIGPNIGDKEYDPSTGEFTYNFPDATVIAEHIEGTQTGTETGSVFNSGTNCGSPNCSFTADDILALQSVYPCSGCSDLGCECPILPTLEGPASFCTDEVKTYCVNGLVDGWTLSTGTEECFEVSFEEPGIQTISIEVCPDGLPDCCVTASIEVEIRERKDGIKCLCVCEAQEQSGRKNPIELWEVEVDCCDNRPCSELIPGWWIEYLIDDRECFNKEEIIPCDPPQVSLSGTGKICIRESGTYCISGVSGPITWNISGMGSITTPGTCLTFTPTDIGNYTISTTVCEDDCCVTKSRDVEVSSCEVECYCECEDGQSGDIIELIYDCNEVGDCQDIFYEDDIYNCKQLTRIR